MNAIVGTVDGRPDKWADRALLEPTGEAAPGALPLLLDRGDTVLEASRANVFIVRDGGLATPPADGRILPGITRARVIEIAGNAGVEVREVDLALTDLLGAEEAFLTAVTVARQQNSRSFKLRAALSLANLYQSTGRAADAHAALTPEIEGFSPTPELPEIEEAQALLAALAETDEVKRTAALRQRRLKLQTSYGQAMMWSKGFGAAETKAAFSRASELAVGAAAAERFPAYYGLWVGTLLRGELESARETAEIFLREANATVLCGVEEPEVDLVVHTIRESCTTRQQQITAIPAVMEPGEFFLPYPVEVEVVILFAIQKGYFDDVAVDKIKDGTTTVEESYRVVSM
jgi:uncharacterized protein YaaQ